MGDAGADLALHHALALLDARPSPSDSALLALLQESAPHFQGRGAGEAEVLRAHLMARIAATGLASSLTALALEALETEKSASLLAAAARSLRLSGQTPDGATDALWRAACRLIGRDEYIDLDHYPPRQAEITALGEIVQALIAVGPRAECQIAELQRMAAGSGRFDASVVKLLAVKRTPSCCASAGGDGPIPDPHTVVETLGSILEVEVEDQHGVRKRLGDLLLGQPSLLAFFYTRCMNPLKCSRTIGRMAELRRRLDAAGVQALVAGITYDPAFDLADRLARYGQDRGMRFSQDCLLLRTTGPFHPVANYLGLGVGYGDSTVNAHRIEWLVSDPAGNVALSRTRAHWDEDELIEVFKKLATR